MLMMSLWLHLKIKSLKFLIHSFHLMHDRLKFIIEYEGDHCLNFLDLSVINKDNTIILGWHHKKMFSGTYLSFYSNHPACHKIDIIYSLVDRAILLSNSTFYNKNIEFIIENLKNNGYPLGMIFYYINKRIKSLTCKKIYDG